MIKIYLFIVYILILGHQCLAQINLNITTTNSTILTALRPPEGRIINGSPAKRGQFPFQVYIISDIYACGGSIINNKTVVTAAHCVYYGGKKNKRIPANKIKVYAGDINKVSTLMRKFDVKKVIPHKKYDTRKFKYDIAILKIKTNFWNGNPIKGANIAPIALASSLVAYNTECTVSGWGTTSTGTTSSTLMHTKVKIYDLKQCDELYTKYTNTRITVSMICAVDIKSNVCTGDSGGPLIVNNTQTGNVPQLIGIVSFGIDGCQTNIPSVYTDVYEYRDWIRKYAGSSGISYQNINSSQFLCIILLSSFILYLKF